MPCPVGDSVKMLQIIIRYYVLHIIVDNHPQIQLAGRRFAQPLVDLSDLIDRIFRQSVRDEEIVENRALNIGELLRNTQHLVEMAKGFSVIGATVISDNRPDDLAQAVQRHRFLVKRRLGFISVAHHYTVTCAQIISTFTRRHSGMQGLNSPVLIVAACRMSPDPEAVSHFFRCHINSPCCTY